MQVKREGLRHGTDSTTTASTPTWKNPSPNVPIPTKESGAVMSLFIDVPID